jgi:hypothetical protein
MSIINIGQTHWAVADAGRVLKLKRLFSQSLDGLIVPLEAGFESVDIFLKGRVH